MPLPPFKVLDGGDFEDPLPSWDPLPTWTGQSWITVSGAPGSMNDLTGKDIKYRRCQPADLLYVRYADRHTGRPSAPRRPADGRPGADRRSRPAADPLDRSQHRQPGNDASRADGVAPTPHLANRLGLRIAFGEADILILALTLVNGATARLDMPDKEHQ